jgi:hypothetical protein
VRSSDAGEGGTEDPEAVDPRAMPPADPWLAAAPISPFDVAPPGGADPYRADPYRADPFPAGPYPTGPVAPGPVAAHPVEAHPAEADPVAADPLPGGPVAADPLPGGPVVADPLPGGPVAADPYPGEPWQPGEVVENGSANRGPGRTILALVTVVVLAGCLGLALLHQFGGDHATGQRAQPSSHPGAAASGNSTGTPSGGATGAAAPAADRSTAADLLVTYEVTASGSHNVGSVEYTDRDGDIIRRGGVPLPWRLSFRVTGQRHPLVLVSQRNAGGDAGPVTCSITAGGKTLTTTTQTGRFAAPECSA